MYLRADIILTERRKRGVTVQKYYCLNCDSQKIGKHFYTSYSSLHKSGKIPICKDCLKTLMNEDDLETVKDTLRKIDRPFLPNVWQSSIDSEKETIGDYFKNLALPQYRTLTWADSKSVSLTEDEEDEPKGEIKKNSKNRFNLSEEKIEELENKWGFGFSPQELAYFEKKYNNLIGNYPSQTSLHKENLKT